MGDPAPRRVRLAGGVWEDEKVVGAILLDLHTLAVNYRSAFADLAAVCAGEKTALDDSSVGPVARRRLVDSAGVPYDDVRDVVRTVAVRVGGRWAMGRFDSDPLS